MKHTFGAVLAIFATACIARAQETRVATFENFNAGDSFNSSFTDPLSGIFFHHSTHPPAGGFVIDYSPTFFGGGNYVTSGAGPTGGLGAYFGFTGDLAAPANHVSIDVYSSGGFQPDITLKALDATGAVAAQDSGPSVFTDPFTLEVTTASYKITKIQLFAGAAAAGYDNISYSVPEPTACGLLAMTCAFAVRRRR